MDKEKIMLNIGDRFTYSKDHLLYSIEVKSADLCELQILMGNYYINDLFEDEYIEICHCKAKNDVAVNQINKAKLMNITTFSKKVFPTFVALEIYNLERTHYYKSDLAEKKREEVYKALKIRMGDYSETFCRKKIEKFRKMEMRGVKAIGYGCKVERIVEKSNAIGRDLEFMYYEAMPKVGEYIISTDSNHMQIHLEFCIGKENEIITYKLYTDDRAFSIYGNENRYLLSYVYERTVQGKKVDTQCIDDLIELIERLDS